MFVCLGVMWDHSVCGILLEGCVWGGSGIGVQVYLATWFVFCLYSALGVGGRAVRIWYGSGGGSGRRRMGVVLCQRKSSNIVPHHNPANTVSR